jgi:hypothetical protein
LRSLDYSTLAAVSVLDKLKHECHFARKSLVTFKSMATLTMQMKLSAAEFATPPSYFTQSNIPKENLRNLPTDTGIPDVRQLQGQISHEADLAGKTYLRGSFQFPQSDSVLPIPCEGSKPILKVADESFTNIPAISRDPENSIEYMSTTDFKPPEGASILAGAIPTPESLQSWNNSNVEASKNPSDTWFHTSEPVTTCNFAHSTTENADIEDGEDLLDAYIVGWT